MKIFLCFPWAATRAAPTLPIGNEDFFVFPVGGHKGGPYIFYDSALANQKVK
jgi:hypothetical protein